MNTDNGWRKIESRYVEIGEIPNPFDEKTIKHFVRYLHNYGYDLQQKHPNHFNPHVYIAGVGRALAFFGIASYMPMAYLARPWEAFTFRMKEEKETTETSPE